MAMTPKFVGSIPNLHPLLVCEKKVQLLKPHNVYVEIVRDLHEFRGPLVE